MSPAARGLFEIIPYALAFAVGALLPRGRSKIERFGLGVVAVLSVLFVKGLWPERGSSSELVEQWPHLLDLIVFLPIFGGVAVMFMPRQSPGFLRAFTLSVLGLDLLISLFLLSGPMDRGWHYQHIVEWIPSLGIRYHVALDGISLWLVLLTTFTTPIAAYVSFGSIKKRIKDLCVAFLILQGAMLGAF